MALIAVTTIFAVLGDPSNTKLAAVIEGTFPGNCLQIRAGQWLIAASGTAKDISDKLGVTPEGGSGPAVIVAVAGYYGRANNQIWEWFVAKMGKPINA